MMVNNPVVVAKVKLPVEVAVLEVLKKAKPVLTAVPAKGALTVQFASPGAQVGFKVSPRLYGLPSGAAKADETKTTEIKIAKTPLSQITFLLRDRFKDNNILFLLAVSRLNFKKFIEKRFLIYRRE